MAHIGYLQGNWLAAILATVLAAFVATPTAVAVELAPGDIIVTGGASGASAGVIRVDPVTGSQTWVSRGGWLVAPIGVAIEPDGDLLVADDIGLLIRVDPATGAQMIVSSGGLFVDPFGVALEPDGDILVTDAEAFDGRGGGVIRVDPETGAQQTLSWAGSFVDPVGLALERDGDIIVADSFALSAWGGIKRVDPRTGAQTRLSSGGLIVQATDVAIEADGDIVAADSNAFHNATGGVIRIDPVTGAQAAVSSGGLFQQPSGIAVEDDGDVLVADGSGGDGRGAVIRVNSATGAQTSILSEPPFVHPTRIAVVPGANDPPDCSAITATPGTLQHAGHDQLKLITLGGARDPDGDELSFHIDSVQQDELVGGKSSSPDAQLVGGTADTSQVRVRAERDPRGNGRVYRIAYTVSDGTDSCSGMATVSVSRNKPHGAVDDGNVRRWDSFTTAQVFP